jgi:hypothetical protein
LFSSRENWTRKSVEFLQGLSHTAGLVSNMAMRPCDADRASTSTIARTPSL